MSSESMGEDEPTTSSGVVRFYQELGFRAAALSMWRPVDVMPSLSKCLNCICVTGCELCVTALGFLSGRSHLTCCNNLQNRCQVMLEDQMLFSCKVS